MLALGAAFLVASTAHADPLRGRCSLSVTAGQRRVDATRLERYGGVFFSAPLGGCDPNPREERAASTARPRLARSRPEGPSDADEDFRPEVAPPEGQTQPEEPEPQETNREARRFEANSEVDSRATIYVISARLAREVVERARNAGGLDSARRRIDGAESRARWAAALPELRLRGARGIDETARVDFESETVTDTSHRGTAELLLEARLTWHLSGLIFSGREPSFSRIRLGLLRESRALGEHALKTLFAWHRALSKAEDPREFPEDRRAAWFEAAEAEVTLNVLTDGWFTSERVRGAPWMVARALPSEPTAPGTVAQGSTSDEVGSRPPAPSIEPSWHGRVTRSAQRARVEGPVLAFVPAVDEARRGPREALFAAAAMSGSHPPGIAPGEPGDPGVNVRRDASRDAKQAE